MALGRDRPELRSCPPTLFPAVDDEDDDWTARFFYQEMNMIGGGLCPDFPFIPSAAYDQAESAADPSAGSRASR